MGAVTQMTEKHTKTHKCTHFLHLFFVISSEEEDEHDDVDEGFLAGWHLVLAGRCGDLR